MKQVSRLVAGGSWFIPGPSLLRAIPRYLGYVLRHKWFVFLECTREGMPWRGLVHDLSKFRPSEFIPYANHFHGRFRALAAAEGKNGLGYYKPTDTGDPAFDHAWFLHQKRNTHHWQYWIMPVDLGGIKALEMPAKCMVEMLADWVGAGRAQGTRRPGDDHYQPTRRWYAVNQHKMTLHKRTREFVEHLMNWSGSLEEREYLDSREVMDL
jgi:hypothetical protein